jgi:hypothetical protein
MSLVAKDGNSTKQIKDSYVRRLINRPVKCDLKFHGTEMY